MTILTSPALWAQSSANFKLAEASSAEPPQESLSANFKLVGAVSAGFAQIGTSRCVEIAAGPIPTRLGVLDGPLQDTDDDNLSDGWELFYAGNLATLAGSNDSDGDGKSDLEELLAATDPTLASSVFRLTAADKTPAGFKLNWTGGPGKVHLIEYSPNLTPGSWIPISSTVMPGSGTDTYTDGDPVRSALPTGFYRVKVVR